MRESSNELQVVSIHYKDISYKSARRVASYEYQIRKTLRHKLKTVIEIGGGSHVVRDELKHNGSMCS